jgi:MerR family transcriptional regulator/heat shock protein HspR
VEQLQRIQQLTQELGINLAGVRMIMELEEQMERLSAQLERTRRRMEEEERTARNKRRESWPLVRLADVRNIFEVR